MDNFDIKVVENAVIGWQTTNPELDSYVNSITNPDPVYLQLDGVPMPEQFWPSEAYDKPASKLNPWTAYRIRHDFQGYALYGRSGSGSQKLWQHKERWDKVDTQQDNTDYIVNFGVYDDEGGTLYEDYGGDLGADGGLPNPFIIPLIRIWLTITNFNEFYQLVNYQEGDVFYGQPIYNHEVVWTQELNDWRKHLVLMTSLAI